MNRGIYELGRLLRAARLERGFTQKELAAAIGTSRSAVALMEQGRRLLDTAALQRIAAYLALPGELVEPFLLPTLQRQRYRTSQLATAPPAFALAVVSGVTGSGKTTLSRALARTFGAAVVGSSTQGKAYIDDLSGNRERWAAEAQMAFIVGKMHGIHEALDVGRPVVVERWYTEDTDVYAKLFHQLGALDDRGMDTIASLRRVADVLLPPPQYIFACHCAPDTAMARIARRRRADASLHSKRYLQKSHELYESWISEQAGPEVFRLDTDANDLLSPGVMEDVISEVAYVLSNHIRSPQMTLFDEGVPSSNRLRRLRPVNIERWDMISKDSSINPLSVSPRVAPIAYLAAPFTGMDSDDPNAGVEHGRLFPEERVHGVIPLGGYRNSLLKIERFLNGAGFSVLLPHRDVNDWGRRTLTPGQAMRQCSAHVATCDLFVGILGRSNGAHYEFGLARASGKPSILINTTSPGTSFLASGADSLTSTDLLVIQCASVKDAASTLHSSSKVAEFVARNFGTKQTGAVK